MMFSDLLRELVKGIKYVPKQQRLLALKIAVSFGVILAVLNFTLLIIMLLIS
jgi:hypothetical protein